MTGTFTFILTPGPSEKVLINTRTTQGQRLGDPRPAGCAQVPAWSAPGSLPSVYLATPDHSGPGLGISPGPPSTSGLLTTDLSAAGPDGRAPTCPPRPVLSF